MKKFWTLYIIALFLPLAFGIGSADAVSYIGTSAPTSRPSVTMARVPTLTLGQAYSTVTSTGASAQQLADCANPLKDRLTTSKCVSNYQDCLKDTDVCGIHFELCTTATQFRKNSLMCLDTLARCPADGIKAIFGTTVTTSDDTLATNRQICDGESVLIKRTFSPDLGTLAFGTGNIIEPLIKEGKNWAAANSVQACNSVADACIKRSCQATPQKCFANDAFTPADASDMVNISTVETSVRLNSTVLTNFINNLAWGQSNVTAYLRDQCRQEVGSNESCFYVVNGKPAKEADLIDRDSINDVYKDVVESGTGARFKANQSNIKEWMATAAIGVLEQCRDTMKGCALQACGGGSQIRCYGLTKNSSTGAVDITADAGGVAGVCQSIVQNDQNCKDIFMDAKNGSATDIWSAVWKNDQTGALADTNLFFAKTYNEAALAQNQADCKNDAEQCVRDACGDNFVDCFISSVAAGNYGNRDITDGQVSGNAFSGGFDQEMARGLCLLNIKKMDTCQAYFTVQYARSQANTADNKGILDISNQARNAWLGQNSTGDITCMAGGSYTTTQVNTKTGRTQTVPLDTPEGKTCGAITIQIFDNLTADIGRYAQEQIGLKANQAKNACEARNKSLGSRNFVWASLADLDDSFEGGWYRSSLSATSNPFGGFCQAQVTIKFSDSLTIDNDDGTSFTADLSKLQKCGNSKIFYAPFGSPVLCGREEGMIEPDCLKEIESVVNAAGKAYGKTQLNWAQKNAGLTGFLAGLGGLAAGGVGGYFAGDAIGKFVTKNDTNKKSENVNACINAANVAISTLQGCSNQYVTPQTNPNCDNKDVDGQGSKVSVKTYTCSGTAVSTSQFGTGSYGNCIKTVDDNLKSIEGASSVVVESTINCAGLGIRLFAPVAAASTGSGANSEIEQCISKIDTQITYLQAIDKNNNTDDDYAVRGDSLTCGNQTVNFYEAAVKGESGAIAIKTAIAQMQAAMAVLKKIPATQSTTNTQAPAGAISAATARTELETVKRNLERNAEITAQRETSSDIPASDALAIVKGQLAGLQQTKTYVEDTTKNKDAKTQNAWKWGGAAVLGGVTGITTGFITSSQITKAANEKVEGAGNDALQVLSANKNSVIEGCYIDGKKVANYDNYINWPK